MSDKKIFAEGIYFNEPSLRSPDFVIGNLQIEVQRFISFLVKNQAGETIKLNILRSKKDPKKIYMEVNTYDSENRVPRSKEEEDTQIQYPDAEPTIELKEEVDTSF